MESAKVSPKRKNSRNCDLTSPSCSMGENDTSVASVTDTELKNAKVCSDEKLYTKLEWGRDHKYLGFKYTTSLKILPRQEFAFKCTDELNTKQKNLKQNDSTKGDDGVDEILWSKEPRLFAREYNNEGKRQYIASHLGRFVQYYWRECDAEARHYYELIREKVPCRLYFDIEYNKRANPGISDEINEALMQEFISELIEEVKIRFDLDISRKNIVDLDSSTPNKFSRHLIVHMPNKELFKDAVSCGVFVKRLIGRLAEEVATGEMIKKDKPNLARYLFVYAKECPKDTDDGSCLPMKERPKTCFVDNGVYTRNRIFRILGSLKKGKPTSAALRIASANEFQFPDYFNNFLFYKTNEGFQGEDGADAANNKCGWDSYARALVDTFVIPIEQDCVNSFILQEKIDTENTRNQQSIVNSVNVLRNASDNTHSSSTTGRSGHSNQIKSSTFPALENFVRNKLATRKGINGSIRSWSVELDHRTKNDMRSFSCGEYDELSRSIITYQIKDNRWCECIQRCHKSNNIMWHVSIGDLTYWQSCHDPDCRLSSFRGERRDLPANVKAEISTYLNEKFEDLDDSFEKALLDISFSHSPRQPSRPSQSNVRRNSGDGSTEDCFEKDFDVDESFEREMLKLDLDLSDTNQTKAANDTKIEGGIEKENDAKIPVTSEFEIDEEFEKALMNLKI